MKRYQRALTDRILDKTLQVFIAAIMGTVVLAACTIKPIQSVNRAPAVSK